MTEANSWSYTRSSLHARCPRALYFYLNEAQQIEARPRQISLSTLVGLAVHSAIAEHVTRWAEGQRSAIKAIVRYRTDYIQSVWDNRNEFVTEVINGASIDPYLADRLKSVTRRILRTFFKAVWPRFDSHDYVMHESLSSFDVGAIVAWVKVDLCTRSSTGQAVITDWKTGKTPPTHEDPLQLDAYALWAQKKLKEPVNNIITQFINVRTGSLVQRVPSAKSLSETKELIERQASSWASTATMVSFPPLPDFGKCMRCPYLSACPDGQTAVDGESGPTTE